MKTNILKKPQQDVNAAGDVTQDGPERLVRTIKSPLKRGSIPLRTIRRAIAEVIAARKK